MNHRVKQIRLGLGAVFSTLLKSARHAERFATNINSLGQTVPEKSTKMSTFSMHFV